MLRESGDDEGLYLPVCVCVSTCGCEKFREDIGQTALVLEPRGRHSPHVTVVEFQFWLFILIYGLRLGKNKTLFGRLCLACQSLLKSGPVVGSGVLWKQGGIVLVARGRHLTPAKNLRLNIPPAKLWVTPSSSWGMEGPGDCRASFNTSQAESGFRARLK